MSRLEIMAKEYVDVYNYLLRYHEESKNIEQDKDGLYVKKDYLVKLLDQNLYETADEKLQAWRDLRWIITMDGRLTKRRRWTSTKRLEYVIHIPLSVGRRLKNLARK